IDTVVKIETTDKAKTELTAFDKMHIFANAEPTSAGSHLRVKSTAFAGAFIASAKATSTLEGHAYSNVYINGNTVITGSEVNIDGEGFGKLYTIDASGKAVGLGSGKSIPHDYLSRSNGNVVNIENSVIFVIGQGAAGIYVCIDEDGDVSKTVTIRSAGLPSKIDTDKVVQNNVIDLSIVSLQNNNAGKLYVPMYVDLSNNKIYGQKYINDFYIRNNTSRNLKVGQIITYNAAIPQPLIQAGKYSDKYLNEAYKESPVITISSKGNTSVALEGWIQAEKGKVIVLWDYYDETTPGSYLNQILTSKDITLRGGVNVAPLWIHDLVILNAAKVYQVSANGAETDMEVYFSNAQLDNQDATLRVENSGDVKLMPYIAEIIAQDLNDLNDNIWDTNVVTGNLVVLKQEAVSLDVTYGTPFRIYYLATAKSVKIIFPGSVEFIAEMRDISASEAQTSFNLDELGRYITGRSESEVNTVLDDIDEIIRELRTNEGKTLSVDGHPNPLYYTVGNVPCVTYTLPNGMVVSVVAQNTEIGAVSYREGQVFRIKSGESVLETGMYQICHDASGRAYMLFLNENGAWLDLTTGIYSSGITDSLVYLGYNSSSNAILTEDILKQFIVPDGDSVSVEHHNRFMDAKNNDVSDYDFLTAVPYYEKVFNGKLYTFFRMTDVMYFDGNMTPWSPVYAVMCGGELITVGRYNMTGQYSYGGGSGFAKIDKHGDATVVISLGVKLDEMASGQQLYVGVLIHYTKGSTYVDNPKYWTPVKTTQNGKTYFVLDGVTTDSKGLHEWSRFVSSNDSLPRQFAQTIFRLSTSAPMDSVFVTNYVDVKVIQYMNPNFQYENASGTEYYKLDRKEIVDAKENEDQQKYIKEFYSVKNAFGIEGFTIEGGLNASHIKDDKDPNYMPVVTYKLKNSIDAQVETLTVKRAYQPSTDFTFFYIFHRELGLVAFTLDKEPKSLNNYTATRIYRMALGTDVLADPEAASKWNLLTPEVQTLQNQYSDPGSEGSSQKVTEQYQAYVYKTNKYNLVSYDRLFYTAYDKANGTKLGTYQIVYDAASAFGVASHGNNTSKSRLNDALKNSGAYILVPAYKQVRLVMLDASGSGSQPADKTFDYAKEGFEKNTSLSGSDTVYRIKSGIWVNMAGEILSRAQTEAAGIYTTEYVQYLVPDNRNGSTDSWLIAGRSESSSKTPVTANTKWLRLSQNFNLGPAVTELSINGKIYKERISEDYAVDIFAKVYRKEVSGVTETWKELDSSAQYVLGGDGRVYLNGNPAYNDKDSFEQQVIKNNSIGTFTSLIGQGSNYGKLYIYNGKFMVIQRDQDVFTGLGNAYVTNDSLFNSANNMAGSNQLMWFLKEWTLSADQTRREMVYKIYENGIILWDIDKKYAAEKMVGGDASETGKANYIIKDTSAINKLVIFSGANVQADNTVLEIKELEIYGDTIFTDYFDKGHYGQNYTKTEIEDILKNANAQYDTIDITKNTSGVAYNTLVSNSSHLDQAISGASAAMSISDWLNSADYRAWRLSSKVTDTYVITDDDGNKITKTKKSPVLVKVTGGILSTPNASVVQIDKVTMYNNATMVLTPSTSLDVGEVNAVNSVIKMGSDANPIPVNFSGKYQSSSDQLKDSEITIVGSSVNMESVQVGGTTLLQVNAKENINISGNILGTGSAGISLKASAINGNLASADDQTISGEDISVTAKVINLVNIDASKTVTINADTDVAIAGFVNAGGAVSISSTSGKVEASGVITTTAGDVTVSAQNDINLTGIIAKGNVNITSRYGVVRLKSDLNPVMENGDQKTEKVKLILVENAEETDVTKKYTTETFNIYTPAIYTENGNIIVNADDDIVLSGDVITDNGKIDILAGSDVTMTEAVVPAANAASSNRNWFAVSAAGGEVTVKADTGSIDLIKTRGIRTKHEAGTTANYYNINMTAAHNIYVLIVDACGHANGRYDDDTDIDLDSNNNYKADFDTTITSGNFYVLTCHANVKNTSYSRYEELLIKRDQYEREADSILIYYK
ncbi:MAG: S-layer family protein, partial [Parasporobacterium sp.]|nr:S-layer family protein [Parasporobacterium sp.]